MSGSLERRLKLPLTRVDLSDPVFAEFLRLHEGKPTRHAKAEFTRQIIYNGMLVHLQMVQLAVDGGTTASNPVNAAPTRTVAAAQPSASSRKAAASASSETQGLAPAKGTPVFEEYPEAADMLRGIT